MSNISDDVDIKRAIENRLYWDDHLNESEIHVRVAEGNVALEGTVPTSGAQEAAAKHAEELPGVSTVKNKLTIWNSQQTKEHTDTELAHTIRRVLTWEMAIGDQPVTVWVDAGTVTLEGVVESNSARQNVEERLRNITGVTHVINHLTVSPAITPGSAHVE